MEASLSLFGFSSTEARLELEERSRSWRLSRAAGFFGAGALLAPILGLVPPHAPWAIMALLAGSVMGLRKWKERFTILSMAAPCPKCGGEVSISSETPLREAMTVSCPGCHHDSRLIVDRDGESFTEERSS